MKLKDIELVKWSQVASQFQNSFPDLSDAFDRLFKKANAQVAVARYPFGTHPVSAGTLQVPYGGQLHAVDSAELPEKIRLELDYPTLPLCAVTEGTLESYIDLPNHLIPLRLVKPGAFFAINSVFNKEAITHMVDRAYSYVSGSRSLLILAKISHEQYNERLARNYSVDKDVLCPKTFSSQWNLFRELACAPEFKSDWATELVFFPRSTVKLIEEDPDTKYLLLDRLWKRSAFLQNQTLYDLVWSIFFEKLSTSIKNAPSILETVKHIIRLCMSEAPGYAPVMAEDQAPIKEFIDIFLNVYRIRYYLPAFMEIGYYNQVDPIYYSLQKHTFFCNIPERGGASRTIDEMLAVKRLILSFKQQVLENKFPFSLENTVLYKTLQEVEFDFYHPQGTTGELETDVEKMVAEDPRFMGLLKDVPYDASLSFPIHSLFFNGCIRIRPVGKKAAEGAKPSMKDFLGTMGGGFRLDDKE